jgi:hypothetical protein
MLHLKTMQKPLLLICFLVFYVSASFSQTITVGSYAESIARMNQVLGISDDLSSFTQHPLYSAFNNKGDSTLQNMVAGKSLLPKFTLLGIPSSIKILPFTWLNDFNSKLPFGYNNGPLYPNVGYQTMISGGVFIKAGILNIQFKPELVHAENSPFLTFADVQANYKSGLIRAFFATINGIDAPERFGPFGITSADLGQSKITLVFKGVEAGVSTENMWWGPGVQNSIMMSNSAPGFLHWTFNSAGPVKTPIGSFEWQLIGGILKQSGYNDYDPGRLVYDPGLYIPKPVVSRYISGFTFNWHPKWVDGLFFGVSGYDYLNRDSVYNSKGFIKKYFPVFSPTSVAQNTNSLSMGDGQDFAYALNVRQVLPLYHAEIYFEYARNDNVANFTDFLLEPEHSTAYTLGGSRAFILGNNQFFDVKMELTHLQEPDTFLLRAEPSWYVHDGVAPADGYSNEGRYLGAGIGPGGNSLMFDFSYIRKMNSYGVKLERYVHDLDLYYNAFGNIDNVNGSNYQAIWVQFSATFYANVKFKKFLVSAEYTPERVLNYEYLQNNNISNTHARITLTYFFD